MGYISEPSNPRGFFSSSFLMFFFVLKAKFFVKESIEYIC
jgi:hypothetical protein